MHAGERCAFEPAQAALDLVGGDVAAGLLRRRQQFTVTGQDVMRHPAFVVARPDAGGDELVGRERVDGVGGAAEPVDLLRERFVGVGPMRGRCRSRRRGRDGRRRRRWQRRGVGRRQGRHRRRRCAGRGGCTVVHAVHQRDHHHGGRQRGGNEEGPANDHGAMIGDACTLAARQCVQARARAGLFGDLLRTRRSVVRPPSARRRCCRGWRSSTGTPCARRRPAPGRRPCPCRGSRCACRP